VLRSPGSTQNSTTLARRRLRYVLELWLEKHSQEVKLTNPSEANSFSVTKESSSIYWSPKVHYCVHRSLLSPTPCVMFCTMLISTARSCYPYIEPPSWRTIRYQLYAAACSLCSQPYLEAISSICNLRTCHAVVTRDPLNMDWKSTLIKLLHVVRLRSYAVSAFFLISRGNAACVCPSNDCLTR
jgi:hypothetical protein